MLQTHEYQLISGKDAQVNATLSAQAALGWKPILLTSGTVTPPGGVGQIIVYVVLERAMEQ